MNTKKNDLSRILSDEQIAIARGDKVNHSAVSQLVEEGNPEILQLVILNKNTHDELKLKALKKILQFDQNTFNLKTKKHLTLKCLKKNNFGNRIYFEVNFLLKSIRQQQLIATKLTLKNQIESILSLQNAYKDVDYQILSEEIKTLKNSLELKTTVEQGFRSSAFWNYIKMVQWSSFFEDDEKFNIANNNYLLQNLEPILNLDEWRQLDRLFDDPINLDSLIYCSFHALAIEFQNKKNEVIRYIEEANKIIDNYDQFLSVVEKTAKEADQQKKRKENEAIKIIEQRAQERLRNQQDRPKKIGVSGVRFLGNSSIYGSYDPVVNNRWP